MRLEEGVKQLTESEDFSMIDYGEEPNIESWLEKRGLAVVTDRNLHGETFFYVTTKDSFSRIPLLVSPIQTTKERVDEWILWAIDHNWELEE